LKRPRSRRATAARVRRRGEERVSREELATRAEFLPKDTQALVHANLRLGMTVEEIAVLHRTTPRQVRRRLERLRERLSDRCFVLAARFGERLPRELAALARAYFIGGATLRALAAARGQTLYRVRHDLAVARSLLVVAMSVEQEVTPELARAAIDARHEDSGRRGAGEDEAAEGLALGGGHGPAGGGGGGARGGR
jgi:hypothetical protein